MSTAQRFLIAYGSVILMLGFGLGVVLGMLRMERPAIRNLATAHVETLLQGAVHLGLAAAVGAVGYDSTTATVAAVLLVIGSAMQATGVTLNWIQGVTDQFAERSLGFMINSASSFLAVPGLVLLVIGVLRRL